MVCIKGRYSTTAQRKTKISICIRGIILWNWKKKIALKRLYPFYLCFFSSIFSNCLILGLNNCWDFNINLNDSLNQHSNDLGFIFFVIGIYLLDFILSPTFKFFLLFGTAKTLWIQLLLVLLQFLGCTCFPLLFWT